MFDLVYTDASHKDLGVVQAYRLDAAWGSDENDFELVMPAPSSTFVDVPERVSKNLFKPLGSIKGGVTVTFSNDGKMSVAGTATSNGYVYLTEEIHLDGGEYTISASRIGSTVSTLYLRKNVDGAYSSVMTLSKTTYSKTGYIESGNYSLAFYRTSGYEYDDGLYVQFELGSTATEYEPYFEPVPAHKEERVNVPALDYGALVYVDGTQIGGVVDDKSPDGTGQVKTVTYHGRTWHGILAYSVIQPDAGADYYTYSGDANDVIRAIITRQGLQDIFECVGASGITVSGRFDRYTDVYSGLMKMLTRDSNKRGKLHIEKKPGGKVALQAVEVARYTSELDSDRYGFKSTLDRRPVNHLICLGEGDLKERDVVHFYADVNGVVSQTQTQFGINERCMTYDANNSDHDELLKSGREKLEDLQKTSSIDMTLVEDAGTFEIGDVVGALDNLTGVYVESIVSKVIASVGESGLATYSYEVGDLQTAKSASGGGVSMATLEAGFAKTTDLAAYVKKSGDTMSGNLIVGATSHTVERNVKAISGAGEIYIYAGGSKTGNRGVYLVNANGEAGYLASANQDNKINNLAEIVTDVKTTSNFFRKGYQMGGGYNTLFSGKNLAKNQTQTFDIPASDFVLFLVTTANGSGINLGIRNGTNLNFIGGTGNGSTTYNTQGTISFSNGYKTAKVVDCSYYVVGTWSNAANNVTGLYGIL